MTALHLHPQKLPCDIFRVADQCGIKLLEPQHHRPGHRKPRQCFAKKTLKKIGQRYGEGHLALTLRLIVETKGNGTELYSETIQAIAVLLAKPEVSAMGGRLFEEFDAISLKEMRQKAKALALGMPVTHTLRVLLALRILRPDQIDMFDTLGQPA